MTDSYNPQSAIDTEEYGNPFETLQTGIDRLLQLAKSRQYQAQVNGMVDIDGVTRFAVNQVTQHTDINNISFALKLIEGKRQASASTTLSTIDGVEKLFDQVENNMKESPEIPFLQGLPSPQPGAVVDLTGTEWVMEDRAEAIVEAVNAAEEITTEFRSAGTVSSRILYSHVISTEGIDVETSTNYNYFKFNAITGPPDGRGYGQRESYWRFERPDIVDMAQDATRTALDTEDSKLITKEAGQYEVVLGPQAVSRLMVFVLFGATAVSYHESDSYASDRLGDQILDEKITVRDLPRDSSEAILARSFDGEGIATTNQDFYERGVLKFIPYSSFMASKYLEDKDMATGHANPFGGAFPLSTAMMPGDRTIQQQLAELEEGLYVKNFWYTRFTKRREGGLTGLTRNGLYYVKDGEIQGAVRNLRYTDSFVRAFGPDNVVSLSSNRTKFFLTHVPSMHLSSYNFSSVAHTNQQLE